VFELDNIQAGFTECDVIVVFPVKAELKTGIELIGDAAG
jgi:hypothetical protein